MRLSFAVLPLILALPLSNSALSRRPVLGDKPDIRAVRVHLDPRDPARTRLGKLTYLGGIRLSSADPAFGGFSSMHVLGDRFTLLSDGGNIVRFRMGDDFVPREGWFGDLPGGPGEAHRKVNRDSEAMAIDPKAGKAWVAFENGSWVYRYDAAFTRVERSAKPRAMAKWGDDMGPESLVRLRDGRFVILDEGPADLRHARPGLIFARDPTEHPERVVKFRYLHPRGYRPTDAAELPDGRLLVVNRRFALSPELFSAKLTILDLRGVRAGELRKGVEIATLARPLLHDNFEGVAITQEKGATIVWLVSDDNGQFWEQSLLLKFRLDP
jgi:hypothetical protein